MHRHYPDPQVLPSPHSRGNNQHASADEKAGLLDGYCGHGQTECPTLSDDYDMDVGLAGALQ